MRFSKSLWISSLVLALSLALAPVKALAQAPETSALMQEADAIWANRESMAAADVAAKRKVLDRINARLATLSAQGAPLDWSLLQFALAKALASNDARGGQALDATERAMTVLTKERYPVEWARTQKLRAELFPIAGGFVAVVQRRQDEAAAAALTVLTREDHPRDYIALTCMRAPAVRRALKSDGTESWRERETFLRQAMLLMTVCGSALDPNPLTEARMNARAAAVVSANPLMAALGASDMDKAFFIEGFRAMQVSAALTLDQLGLAGENLRQARALRGEAQRLLYVAKDEQARTAGWRAQAQFVDLVLGAPLLNTRSRIRTPRFDGAVSVMIFDAKRGLAGAHKDGDVKVIATPGDWTTRYTMQMVGQGLSQGASRAQFDAQARGAPAVTWMKYYADGDFPSAIDEFRKEYEPTYSEFIRDAANRAGVRRGARLTILPDGAAAMLPITLLRDPKTGRTLLEDYEIVFAPSLEAAVVAQTRAAQARADGLAIVAPDAAETGLAFSVAESEMARAATGSAGVPVARKADVAGALSGAGIWHFITHGAFFADQPLESALVLAGDERLTLADLLHAETPLGAPRLVLLSACETGLFDTKNDTDDFIGLPTGFLQAGAAGVIASLWPVSDASTSLLMARFYQAYRKEGQSPPAALRTAQLWLKDARMSDLETFITARETERALSPESAAALRAALARIGGERPFASPFFWGAFVYYGA